jgi:hypothetical protein
MAQVYVPRSDLLSETANNPVRVLASYGNGMVLTVGTHGPTNTRLLLADNLVFSDLANSRVILTSHWRDDYKPVVNDEAARRINLVYPEYKQRNYTAKVQEYITLYGADATMWPQAAKDFKAEADRGWQYVEDVRTASNAMTAMPADPTADEHWPPAISPIV